MLGEQLAQKRERVVPGAMPTPCLDTFVVDICIQDRGKMEEGDVLDVDGKHWLYKSVQENNLLKGG